MPGMRTSRTLPLLLAGLLAATATSSPSAADAPAASAPARSIDPTRARQEADRQRLIAKLRDDAPKVRENTPRANPLDLPIFRRNDRP